MKRITIVFSALMMLLPVFAVGQTVSCDVNSDGEVNIADVTYVIGVILDYPVASDLMRADVNRDGEVTIADVNALIDRILSEDATAGHNVFGLSPDDLDPNKTYDIDGFVSIYRDQLEFIPIRIVPHGYNPVQPPIMPPDRYDVNGDGEITIADVNCLIDLILSH